MKKQLTVLGVLIIIFVCLCVAIVYSNDRKTTNDVATTSQVKSLQDQLQRVQTVQTLHDQANTATVKNAGEQILTLQQQKTTLCTQIKNARLVQPLCN